MIRLPFRPLLGLLFAALACSATAHAADKRLLLIAGPPSHESGSHEHNAGVLLMQKCLADVPGLRVDIALNGWPEDRAALERADAVLIFADGGARHMALDQGRLEILNAFAARGGGIGLMHYAVEPTKAKGQTEFLRWIGGCFEIHWSVNPLWTAEIKSLPEHPVARGVRPFTVRDEWYFHMRFVEDKSRLTPLLAAVPPASTMSRRDGPHSGNPAARAAVDRGEPQTLAWAFEREDGGRGFGFTGAHTHANWAHDDYRKLVLNALVWLAKVNVPADGVQSRVTPEDIAANLDPKPQKK